MGRKRKIKLTELARRTMDCCKCGRPVEVLDASVESVKCAFCTAHVIPLRTTKDFEIYDKIEEEKEKSIPEQTVRVSKNGKRLGRPPKKSQIETITPDVFIKKKAQQKRQREAEKKSEPVIKSPQKISKEKISKTKKGKGKMTVKPTKGKRGRKATVGAKILAYLADRKGENVDFADILSVYSEERERLGKKNPDAHREEMNCRSTLFIMIRDGKIKEVEKKKVYTSA